MQISLSDLTLNYELTMPATGSDRGLGSLCLLHCFGSDHHFWDMQMPWLDGFSVLRPDARGHGQSARPTGPYALSELAQDVILLLDHLKIERVHLGGASMGGMVAQWLAMHHPDRVASLQLITTTFEYSQPQRDAWFDLATRVHRGGVESVQEQLMLRWFSEPSRDSDCPGFRYMSSVFRQFHPDAFAWACEAVRNVDLGADLHRIQAPCLVVASEHDPGVPACLSRRLADAIPDAKLRWTPFAHHLASLEHPEIVGWLMRSFLDQNVAGVSSAAI